MVTAVVENKEGSTLPSTGGIGTTLFYVGGGAMVAVAGVFLITKKRMGRKED
ncbi:MAG: LPXTG cell wall anchor domain-containing protein [Oscillospiraceae bacterium]|nr:LPXTG cell wall anchor domain-containing protein [Oscillospiraceae bacterium]